MPYVTEQTSSELRAHVTSLQKIPGWHEPLVDRLFVEVKKHDDREVRFARLLAEMNGDEILSEQQCARFFGVDLVSWREISHTFSRGSAFSDGPISMRGPTSEQAILKALSVAK